VSLDDFLESVNFREMFCDSVWANLTVICLIYKSRMLASELRQQNPADPLPP